MKNSKEPKIVRFPRSFTKEDFEHCVNCIHIVNYFLDKDTDGEPFTVQSEDIEYLGRLLCREYQTMCEVLKASGGSNNVI